MQFITVANLFKGKIETRTLSSDKGTSPSHRLSYCVWMTSESITKLKKRKPSLVSSVNNNIKFTREDEKNNKLPFLE